MASADLIRIIEQSTNKFSSQALLSLQIELNSVNTNKVDTYPLSLQFVNEEDEGVTITIPSQNWKIGLNLVLIKLINVLDTQFTGLPTIDWSTMSTVKLARFAEDTISNGITIKNITFVSTSTLGK